MTILIIKDNKPGHYNQTEGILLALKVIYPQMNVEYVEIEIRSKISRKLLRVLLNNFLTFLKKDSSLKYISFFYKKFNLPKNKPDMIISTGGNTANLNAWFAKVYNAKNILNGRLRGLREELFTKITTVIDLGYKNQIVIDVAPNIITSEKLETEAKNFLEKHHLSGDFYSLLVGGDGAGYIYNDTFYEKLIHFVIMTSKRDKIKWLITTSRRTPLEIEEKLRESLEDYCAYFVAYNKKPEKVLSPFLGLSHAVFVTEESSSMISESISARKPVYTLYAYKTQDKNYHKLINKFEKEKKIIRINIIKNNQGLNDEFDILQEDYYIKLAKQLEVLK